MEAAFGHSGSGDEKPIVFTIGHGAGTFTEIERHLTEHHVGMLVDVRSAPVSRHAPDFDKRRLTAHAAAAGLGYRWLGDRLGGRPTDPALRDSDGNPDPTAIAHGPGFEAGLDEIEALAQSATVAILCSEASPWSCHRATLIAPHLEDRGYRIVHILPDGSTEVHQPALAL